MVRDSGIPYTVSSGEADRSFEMLHAVSSGVADRSFEMLHTVSSGVADSPSTVLFSGARGSLFNTNWSNMAGLSDVQVPILQFGQWRQSISAPRTILTGVSGESVSCCLTTDICCTNSLL